MIFLEESESEEEPAKAEIIRKVIVPEPDTLSYDAEAALKGYLDSTNEGLAEASEIPAETTQVWIVFVSSSFLWFQIVSCICFIFFSEVTVCCQCYILK